MTETYASIRKVGRKAILALCDAEILGKTLHDGRIVFHVSREFYEGARVDVEEAMVMIGNFSIVNMIGKNVVGRAIEKGLVHPEGVLNIEGVPHAQIVRL